MATQRTPDFSKVENLLRHLDPKFSLEKKVLKRYEQLAGLVRGGEMVNKDKEVRARAWVAEQEKVSQSSKTSWHQTWWGQVVIGLFITVSGGLIVVWVIHIYG